MTMPIPLAFWAEDQADAERQALEWSAAEPKIAEARVIEASRTLGTKRWTITVDVTMRDEPQQTTMGLA